MKGVKIEIVRDQSAEGAGDAIIRLIGLLELPEQPVFRIAPLDEEASLGDAPGWPKGDLKAKRMRVGTAGVELVVAGDIVDSPALLPGTPVAIVVPSASIREELRWPALPPVRKAQRSAVVVSAEKRRAEIAARAKARRAELENMAAVRMAAATASQNSDSDKAEAESDVAVGEGLSRLDMKRKGSVKLVASRDLKPEAAAPPTSQAAPALPSSPIAASAAQPNLPPLPKGPPSIDMAKPVAQVSHAIAQSSAPSFKPPRHQGPIAAPGTPANPPLPPLPDSYRKRVDALAQAPSAAVAPVVKAVAPQQGAAPPPVPVRHGPPLSSTMRPGGAPPSLPPDTPKFLRRPSDDRPGPFSFQKAFGLGFLVAAVLAVISSFAFRSDLLTADPPATPVQALMSKPAETLTTLSTIVAVPDVSTRGSDASNVDLAAALSRADKSLSSGAGDKDEAKYWLRKALSLGLGDKRLVWAITQLGTLYAAPASGSPDYAAARTLWELASAQRDPVALCFLAALHEHGLGVAKDRVRALVLYRNAKAEGGCRGVDQSIARLTKGSP